MFQCNEHVEMNKFLCSLACTWMTIIDSQFYIIDSLSLMFHWNKMLTWWLPGCNKVCTSLVYLGLILSPTLYSKCFKILNTSCLPKTPRQNSADPDPCLLF